MIYFLFNGSLCKNWFSWMTLQNCYSAKATLAKLTRTHSLIMQQFIEWKEACVNGFRAMNQELTVEPSQSHSSCAVRVLHGWLKIKCLLSTCLPFFLNIRSILISGQMILGTPLHGCKSLLSYTHMSAVAQCSCQP